MFLGLGSIFFYYFESNFIPIEPPSNFVWIHSCHSLTFDPIMSLLLHRPPNVCLSCRAFSTTTPKRISLQLEKNDSSVVADTVPAYPYGPARWYKQSNKGLYGGVRIHFGNNVGTKIAVKTRRTWQPNILRKRLFSRALDRHVQVRVSTRVLRTVEKCGGLDEYLLGEKEARVRELGESGWWLRWAIMQTEVVKRRFRQERERLGVDVLEREVAEAASAELEIYSGAREELQEEAVPTDDAFQIEQPASLPPLKFRVGYQQHIVLTPDGWRRTRPSKDRDIQAAKEPIRQSDDLADFVETRMQNFEEKLKMREREVARNKIAGKRGAGKGALSDEARKLVLKGARRVYATQRRRVVNKRYRVMLKERTERTMRMRAKKRESEREMKKLEVEAN